MLIERSSNSVGGKIVVGEVRGVDLMGEQVAGSRTRNRGDRRRLRLASEVLKPEVRKPCYDEVVRCTRGVRGLWLVRCFIAATLMHILGSGAPRGAGWELDRVLSSPPQCRSSPSEGASWLAFQRLPLLLGVSQLTISPEQRLGFRLRVPDFT